jgi:hypothetical protein
MYDFALSSTGTSCPGTVSVGMVVTGATFATGAAGMVETLVKFAQVN